MSVILYHYFLEIFSRIPRQPRYQYYWGLDIRTKGGSRYPYCKDKIYTLSESQRGCLGNRTCKDTEIPVYFEKG